MKGQKGITLVALVITIIVMLILVAVTVTVALNGGLFDTARIAGNKTNDAQAQENNLASGVVNIGSNTYNIADFVDNTDPGTYTPAE